MPCNIGIALDSNNIPVIWKNRDRPICPDQECITEYLNPPNPHTFPFNPNLAEQRASWIYLKNNGTNHDIISISSATNSSVARYMAANDKGLVIVNSSVDSNYGD